MKAYPSVMADPLSRAPFSADRIPAARIDPTSAKFASLFPDPNSAGSINRQYGIAIDNWLFPSKLADWSRNFGIGRVDYNPTDNDRFFATFAISTSAATKAPISPTSRPAFPPSGSLMPCATTAPSIPGSVSSTPAANFGS